MPAKGADSDRDCHDLITLVAVPHPSRPPPSSSKLGKWHWGGIFAWYEENMTSQALDSGLGFLQKGHSSLSAGTMFQQLWQHQTLDVLDLCCCGSLVGCGFDKSSGCLVGIVKLFLEMGEILG